jgi:hypothetical protein
MPISQKILKVGNPVNRNELMLLLSRDRQRTASPILSLADNLSRFFVTAPLFRALEI